ncbi:hypothetical protein RhiirA4_481833 [Rhizophagus irregularis]|uniref:Uncharacterized protein n=1 Tax=Rhizophagus irregularis TaxID=588596 RepID=A0A2I1HK90_9GLOM|nr:hypothetical protein RhiirA4_481833 [Rhizophagus irregularis]
MKKYYLLFDQIIFTILRILSGIIETNISRQKNTAGFIDDEKYKILVKLAGSLILHDEYLLAERLGNIKITVALWIRRVQTSLVQEE